MFLHYMNIPDDDNLLIDMQQAAIYILSNLDMYCSMYSPVQEQEVILFHICYYCENCFLIKVLRLFI